MCPEEGTLSNPIVYFLFLEPGWLCANLVSPSSRSPLATQLESLCSVHKANWPLHTWAESRAGAAHLNPACRGRGREDSFIEEECCRRERIQFSGSSKPEIWHPFFLTLGNVGHHVLNHREPRLLFLVREQQHTKIHHRGLL
uniref:Uncharacterized protein n=1 Tax=Pipistrellus kuhlii TaxID=59472 RepID=A0A7J7U8G2_PIPKU|nr:hypothetical protein mPipKuh1_009180 [Pipistrellus kuhlii]